MGSTVAKILDVAEGVQKDQFTVGDRSEVSSLDDLVPIYQLLDEPVTPVLAVTCRVDRVAVFGRP